MAIGMYHCEYCGVMVLAGLPHPSDDDVRFQGLEPYGEWIERTKNETKAEQIR